MPYTKEEIEEIIRQASEEEYLTYPINRFLEGVSFGLVDKAPYGAETTAAKVLGFPAEIAGFALGPGKVLETPMAAVRLGGLGLGTGGKMLREAAKWGVGGALYETPKAIATGELGRVPIGAAEWGVTGGVLSGMGSAFRRLLPKPSSLKSPSLKGGGIPISEEQPHAATEVVSSWTKDLGQREFPSTDFKTVYPTILKTLKQDSDFLSSRLSSAQPITNLTDFENVTRNIATTLGLKLPEKIKFAFQKPIGARIRYTETKGIESVDRLMLNPKMPLSTQIGNIIHELTHPTILSKGRITHPEEFYNAVFNNYGAVSAQFSNQPRVLYNLAKAETEELFWKYGPTFISSKLSSELGQNFLTTGRYHSYPIYSQVWYAINRIDLKTNKSIFQVEEGAALKAMMRDSNVWKTTKLISYKPIRSASHSISGMTASTPLMGLVPKNFEEGIHYASPLIEPVSRWIMKGVNKINLPFWRTGIKDVWGAVRGAYNEESALKYDLADDFAKPFARLLKDTSEIDRAGVAKVLLAEDIKSTSMPELVLQLNPVAQDYYQTIRRYQKKGQEYFAERLAWQEGIPQKKQLLASMDANDARVPEIQRQIDEGMSWITQRTERNLYRIPHTRQGEFGVAALDKSNKLLGFDLVERKDITPRIEEMAEEFPTATDFNWYRYSDLHKQIWFPQLPYDYIDNLMMKADLGPEATMIVKDVYNKAKHNFGEVRRRNILGWKQNLENIIKGVDYEVEANLRSMTKHKMMHYANQAINTIQDVDTKAYANEFLQNVAGGGHTSLHWLRYGLSLWYLSLKPAFALQNTTQTFLYNYSEIVKSVGLLKAIPLMTKSYANGYKMIKGVLGEEKMKFYKRAMKEGEVVSQYAEEVWGMRGQKFGNAISGQSKVSKVASAFQRGTEHFNRAVSLDAGYETGKAKGLKGEELYKFAIDFIHRTQFPYGPENLPLILSEKGTAAALLRVAYIFRSFQANSIERLLRIYTPKVLGGTGEYGVQAKLAQLISLGTLSGMLGIPSALLIKRIANRKGVDLEEKMRNYITENSLTNSINDALEQQLHGLGISKELLEDVEGTVMLKGVPALAGIETSGWIGLGDLIPSDADNVMGAVQGLGKQGLRAIEDFMDGKNYEGVQGLMPTALKNLTKGVDWIREGGIRTADGEFLHDASTWDSFLKAMSIPVTTERRAKEIKYVERSMIARNRAQTHAYASQLAKAIFDKDRERVEAIRGKLAEHNRDTPPHLRINVSSESLKNELLKLKRGRGMVGIPKKMRREVGQMRKD